MRNRKDYNDEEWDNLCQDDALCVSNITVYLHNLGYGWLSEQNLLETIRQNHINISKFKLPYDAHSLADWQKQIDAFNEMIKNSNISTDGSHDSNILF